MARSNATRALAFLMMHQNASLIVIAKDTGLPVYAEYFGVPGEIQRRVWFDPDEPFRDDCRGPITQHEEPKP